MAVGIVLLTLTVPVIGFGLLMFLRRKPASVVTVCLQGRSLSLCIKE